MSELANYVPNSVERAPVTQISLAAGSLMQWAEQARAAHAIATSLALTSFVPGSLRVTNAGNADANHAATLGNITAALLTGEELGLSPMSAMRSIDIINGTPALRAVTLRALLQQRGHLIFVAESTATRAIVKGRRNGTEPEQTSTWTIERAKTLGLTGKSNWKNQPTAMLLARATAECARLVASDAILGLPYIAEEIADGETYDEQQEVEASAPVRRTAQRAKPKPQRAVMAEPAIEPPAPQTIAEPSFDDVPATAVPEAEPVESITAAQLTKYHATVNDLGWNRDEALAFTGGTIGRPIASSKDLTKHEAMRVIDEMNLVIARNEPGNEPESISFDPETGEYLQ